MKRALYFHPLHQRVSLWLPWRTVSSRGNSEVSVEGKTERSRLMGVSYLTIKKEWGKLVEEGAEWG
jgi:hypothetical protein